MKTHFKILFFALLSVVLFSSCAHNGLVDGCLQGQTYGFWPGLWHGCIMFYDLIGMIFWNDVIVYAPNNTGGAYAFGFVLGAAFGIGGITKIIIYIIASIE